MRQECEIHLDIDWDVEDMSKPMILLQSETLPLLTKQQVNALIKEFTRLLRQESDEHIKFTKENEPEEYAAWKRCPKCQGKPADKPLDHRCCKEHFRKES